VATSQYRPHSADVYTADASLELGSHGIVLRMVGSGRRVLELGCAAGSVTKVFAERGCRVTAIEIDPDAAQLAKEWAEEVIVGDLDVLDLPAALGDATFDVIVAADVLEHLRDPARCLQACLERLAPEGEVVLSIPNVAHGDLRLALLQGEFEYRPVGLLDESHLRFFTRESLEQFLADNQLIALEWDRVEVGVGGSEITWDRSVDSSVLAWVIGQPDADTYQFVLRAAVAPEGGHLREVGDQRDAARRELAAASAALQEAQQSNEVLRTQVAACEAELETRRTAMEDLRATLSTTTRDRDEYKASFAQLAGVQDELVAARRSESYRLGNALLSPLVSTRRLLRAWKRAGR
jgi:2-polyprenyl-3-methyl-5-hydroxy-6-metoxy-1,4-benzoquinol methylase